MVFGELKHLGNLPPVLDIEDAKITGDVDGRAAAWGAAALLPTRLRAVEHGARGALHPPVVRRVERPAILAVFF